VTTTGSRMAVIQGFLGFIKREATSKNRVNPTTIKGITEDNILTCLVEYLTEVRARQIGLESLGLEIYDDISIPNVIGTDQEKGFIK
jgi:hypothetical protein